MTNWLKAASHIAIQLAPYAWIENDIAHIKSYHSLLNECKTDTKLFNEKQKIIFNFSSEAIRDFSLPKGIYNVFEVRKTDIYFYALTYAYIKDRGYSFLENEDISSFYIKFNSPEDMAKLILPVMSDMHKSDIYREFK